MRLVVKYDGNRLSTEKAGQAFGEVAYFAATLNQKTRRPYQMAFRHEVMRSGHALIVIIIDEKALPDLEPQEIATSLGERLAAILKSGLIEVDVDFGKDRTGNFTRRPRKVAKKKRPDS